MARVPLVSDADTPPKVQALYDQLPPGKPVPDLYRALAQSPDVLVAWTGLAWPLRFMESTPRDLRELLILRIAQITGSDYEWHHHVPMAAKAGVSAEQIDALAQWEGSDLFTDHQRAALRYVESVVEATEVDEESYAALEDAVGPTGIVDITVTAAWYLAVSRVIAALGPFSESDEGAGSHT